MKFFYSPYSLLLIAVLIFSSAIKGQYISVNTGYTADQLVKDIFIGSKNASCITVDNVKVTGWDFGSGDLSYGYFNRNTTSFEIDEGIILSSGKAPEAVGAFTGIQSATASGWGGDPDLETGANITNTTNATILEFDFTSNQSDKISFDYMFLSEQYLRTTDPGTCGYTDGFAFLIKKIGDPDYTNIAVIPGTETPITSNNVRGVGGKCPAVNDNYFGRYNPDNSAVSFNGQTAILTAKTDVVPGQKYHIKLVIADQGNGLYDSGVFLKAGSFTGNINLGPDLTLDNEIPLCKGGFHDIKTISGGVSYRWFRNGIPIPGTDDIDTYRATQPGDYNVKIELSSGCTLEGNLRIEDAPVANIDSSAILICDDDFDGKFTEKLSKYNTQIVTNFSREFTIEYFTQGGVKINPDSDFEFTQNPQDITVKVRAFNCTPDSYTIQFYHGQQLTMDYPQQPVNPPVFDVCDNELKGNVTKNLDDYIPFMTNEILNPNDVNFYEKESDLKKSQNAVNKQQTLSTAVKEKTFYIRIKKPGNFCDNYSSFKLAFKQPKKSTVLKDTIICKGTTVDLDAGTGFDPVVGSGFTSYKWDDGSTTRIVKNKPAGEYWVELGFNGCIYKQFVKVSEPEDLIISNVLIEDNKVIILPSNGIPPYQYSLDGQPYQSSNVYENVTKGRHTIIVRDACGFVAQDFSIIGIKNVITPNDDGFNDFIDYSDLMTKSDPRLEIYDRNGQLVFKGDPNNQYIWSGKTNGRPLSTSSYWYILEWNESGNPKRAQHTGWIFLKNRN